MTETEFNFKLRLLKAIEKDQELMAFIEKNTSYPNNDDFDNEDDYNKAVDYAEIEVILNLIPDIREFIDSCITYSMTDIPEDNDWQCYVDEDNKIIPEGYPIGFTIGGELCLFKGVRYYSD